MATISDVLQAFKKADAESTVRHQQLTAKLDAIEKKFDVMDGKIAQVEVKVEFLNNDLEHVKGCLNDIQQKEIMQNVIIKGVPKKANEKEDDLKLICLDIFRLLKLPTINCVTKVRRVGKVGLLLVTFGNLETKQMVLSAKRKTQISAQEIKLNGAPLGQSNQLIYIDDHLTHFSNNLFHEARKLKTDLKAAFVWTKNGRIYLKQTSDSKPFVINSQLDIDTCRRNIAANANSTGGLSTVADNELERSSIAQKTRHNTRK